MKKFKRYIIIVCIILFPDTLFGEIQIKYKIDDQIITNVDILNEKNYLIFLRPNLKNISNKDILKISVNSLIKEIIKKKELDKIFKKNDNSKFINEVKKNLLAFKKVKNESELKELIETNNISYEEVIEKIKYESLWNEFIYKKYSSYVKIDETVLKKKLKTKMLKTKKYEYNLSEILFEVEPKENLKNKYKKISDYINFNDFKAAAARYSISDSSNKGGEIGWVKETLLSNEINNILSKMNENEISNPIKYPNGYLILKINKKKKIKKVFNFFKKLKNLIKFKKNKPLNQFSLLLFKKLKQNTVIYEY